MRSLLFGAGTGVLVLLAPSGLSQGNPCPAGTLINNFRSQPVPNAFSSIVGLPGTVTVFLPPTDDVTSFVPFPAGFAFTYYGVAKTQVGICSNGWITFSATISASATNRHPGDGVVPNDAVFAWHDDLVVLNPGSSVDYRFDLAPGAEKLTVQWTGVGNFVTATPSLAAVGSFTFQCVLYASTHATLPNRIEFRYDRATAPPVMGPCQTTNPSTLSTSATIGCENGAADPLTIGVEPSDRGAANESFPPCDIRLLPATYTSGGVGAAASLVLQEPFCHIEGLPGTVAIPLPCTGGCYDDENSTQMNGVPIPLAGYRHKLTRNSCSAVMSANGLLAFGQGAGFLNAANALPSTAEPELIAAPFWDDLEADPTSGMFYRVDGPPGCRVMTFEWHSFGAFSAPGGDCLTGGGNISTQVKIFEGSAGALGIPAMCPYNLVFPGDGNDRIEFHYDHANFVSGPFTASIGFENHNGTVSVSCLPGALNAAPPAGMKCVIDQCDFAVARFYGDANSTAPPGSACLPRIKTNSVPPVIGNPFGLKLVGATPGGFAILLLGLGGPLPGLKTPVPCGGLPTPFGTFWVDPFSSSTLILHLVPTSPGGPCQGCAAIDLPIPPVPSLAGALLFAEWVVLSVSGGSVVFEQTEGTKIIVG